jgi:hypothetical protein
VNPAASSKRLLGVGEWEAAFRRVEQATIQFEAMQGNGLMWSGIKQWAISTF